MTNPSIEIQIKNSDDFKAAVGMQLGREATDEEAKIVLIWRHIEKSLSDGNILDLLSTPKYPKMLLEDFILSDVSTAKEAMRCTDIAVAVEAIKADTLPKQHKFVHHFAVSPKSRVDAARIELAGDILQEQCFNASYRAGRWDNNVQGNPMCFSQKLCLIHSEISESVEGDRKNLMDDKLPHRPMREVELADAVIRIFDLAGAYNMDLGGAIAEKMRYNETRADHKPENRALDNGKKY